MHFGLRDRVETSLPAIFQHRLAETLTAADASASKFGSTKFDRRRSFRRDVPPFREHLSNIYCTGRCEESQLRTMRPDVAQFEVREEFELLCPDHLMQRRCVRPHERSWSAITLAVNSGNLAR